MLVALGWAGFTGHVWEDYYITYRASKNLATGQGLTYTAGERVHSFTSPLGVLLPAGASLLTGNRSDVAALWIFRVLAAAALGGAVCVLAALARRAVVPGGGLAAGVIAALLVANAKVVDCTINGMESPFLLLFLAWALWAHFTESPRSWLPLGVAWAGLMWTRPDAFIYIGALAVAVMLFRPGEGPWWRKWGTRLGQYLRAGAVTTLLYLPWLVWAWWYYGTPVPHTIIAKGLYRAQVSPGLLLDWLIAFPGRLWSDPAILAGVFMPAYSHNTGWPAGANLASAGVAAVAMLLWLLPRLHWLARVASFGALAGHFYLYAFVAFPVPWYLPPISLLSITALGLALGQVARAGVRQWGVWPAVILLVGGSGALAGAAAWQLRLQQKIIEDGQRQQIGEWLKAQAASPRDTVFLEPLGYIGFFSGLKMLDFPGLSSPEVVAARRRTVSQAYPYCWSEVIMDLQPTWLVLRPYERDSILGRDPEVLTRFYDLARVFDVRAEVEARKFLPGRGYLMNDAVFAVYHRKAHLPAGVSLRRVQVDMLTRRDAWGQPAHYNGQVLVAHAPSWLEFPLPAGARWLSGGTGFLDGAYANPPNATDGAVFQIVHVSASGVRTVLLDRSLDPVGRPGDRGTVPFRVELPAGADGRLELRIAAGPRDSNAFDWTYWADLLLETPHAW